MLRKAFTLIELIFVIVIIGVLSAIAMPRFQDHALQDATDQLIKHIRFTQALALAQDHYNDTNPIWFNNRWTIVFHQNVGNPNSYSIMSGANFAVDPHTGLLIAGAATGTANNLRLMDVDLEDEYNVNIDMGNCNFPGGTTAANQISFDYLGRPHCIPVAATLNPYSSIANNAVNVFGQNMTIRLTHATSGETRDILIEAETGFVR